MLLAILELSYGIPCKISLVLTSRSNASAQYIKFLKSNFLTRNYILKIKRRRVQTKDGKAAPCLPICVWRAINQTANRSFSIQEHPIKQNKQNTKVKYIREQGEMSRCHRPEVRLRNWGNTAISLTLSKTSDSNK